MGGGAGGGGEAGCRAEWGGRQDERSAGGVRGGQIVTDIAVGGKHVGECKYES